MGRIIEANFTEVRPLDLFLVRDDFRKLLEQYDSGNFRNILPGISREIDSEYFVIDGTHRAMIYAVTGDSLPLYVAENNQDVFQQTSFPNVSPEHIRVANLAVTIGFDRMIQNRCIIVTHGILSFDDLKDEYGIHSLDDIRKFVDKKIDHKWAMTYRGDGY